MLLYEIENGYMELEKQEKEYEKILNKKAILDSMYPNDSEKEKLYSVDLYVIKNLFDGLNIKFHFNKCYVAKSNIHGNGVFAKCNIKKDDVISIYPAHTIIYRPDNETEYTFNSIYIKKEIGRDVINRYTLQLDASYSICGHYDLFENMDYVGHIINDYHIPFGGNYDSIDCVEKKRNVYNMKSQIKTNCKYHVVNRLCALIVATKDIMANDELFVPYGYDYWKDNYSHITNT